MKLNWLSKNSSSIPVQSKSLGPGGFTGGTLPNTRRTNTYLLQTIPKYWRGRNMAKLISQGQCYLKPKHKRTLPEKKITDPISLINIKGKMLSNIQAKQIQQHTKTIIHHGQWNLSLLDARMMQNTQIEQYHISH